MNLQCVLYRMLTDVGGIQFVDGYEYNVRVINNNIDCNNCGIASSKMNIREQNWRILGNYIKGGKCISVACNNIIIKDNILDALYSKALRVYTNKYIIDDNMYLNNSDAQIEDVE